MTSSNGNIFRFTGHLCREFTGHRWIPHTKASDAELWCFLDLRLNKRFSKQWWGWWFETPSHPLLRHCNDVLKHQTEWASQTCQDNCSLPGDEYMDSETRLYLLHDDVIKWKHFPCYWPFVRGIHRLLVNSPHKDQGRGALAFSLLCAWTNGWINNRDAGDFKCHRAHYDLIVISRWWTVVQRNLYRNRTWISNCRNMGCNYLSTP